MRKLPSYARWPWLGGEEDDGREPVAIVFTDSLGLKSLELQLKEQNDLLKRTADDQKRIRDAFEKLPETAPLYNR